MVANASRCLPIVAVACQCLPMLANACRQLLIVAQGCQLLPTAAGAWRCLPILADGCQQLPTVADICRWLPMVAEVKSIRKGKIEGESTFIFSCCTFMFLVPATCCRQLSNHVKLCYFVGTTLLISKSNIQHKNQMQLHSTSQPTSNSYYSLCIRSGPYKVRSGRQFVAYGAIAI